MSAKLTEGYINKYVKQIYNTINQKPCCVILQQGFYYAFTVFIVALSSRGKRSAGMIGRPQRFDSAYAVLC